MTKLLRLTAVAFLGAGCMLMAARADDTNAGKLKILIVDGQNNHAWQETTPQIKKWLEASGRFAVDVATAPTRPQAPPRPKNITDPNVKAKYEDELAKFRPKEKAYQEAMEKFTPAFDKYAAVISNYNGDNWPAETREALENYVESGKGGLVIIHAANNSFPGWNEYNQMIGMGWRGSGFGDRLFLDEKGQEVRVDKGKGTGSGHGRRHAFKVTIRDREHPIVQGMPAEWMHATDELYHGLRGPLDNLHLIATAYSDPKSGGTGEHEPMIWTVTYGKGRVFHTPMGHDLEAMRCLGFISVLQRGAEWAATGNVSIPLPKEFPTATTTSSAK
jgi:type 1 glutamine amidotransferase